MTDDEESEILAEKMRRFGRGVIGLAKASVGIDRSAETQTQARMAICKTCPSGLYKNGRCDRSQGGCGCYLAAKWRIASEKCPKGHW